MFYEAFMPIFRRTGQIKEKNPDFIKRGDAAVVVFEPARPMVIETKTDVPQLSTFAIRDMGITVGAGMCTSVVPADLKKIQVKKKK